MSYSREDVKTHYGSHRPAVNVKVGLWIPGKAIEQAEIMPDDRFTPEWIEQNVSEETQNEIFWQVCEWRWEDLVSEAEETFGPYAKVEQDGRSGGWCVVTGLPDINEWDAVMLGKWRHFEKFARATADYIPVDIVESIYINEFQAWADDQLEEAGLHLDVCPA